MPESETAADLAAQPRTILSRLKRRLREQGGRGELTPSQVSVLLRLEKDGAATVSALARAEGMRPQANESLLKTVTEWLRMREPYLHLERPTDCSCSPAPGP